MDVTDLAENHSGDVRPDIMLLDERGAGFSDRNRDPLAHRGDLLVPRHRYDLPVDWRQLDFLTKAGLVAAVMAVLGVVVPPVGVTSAFVAIAFSGTAAYRAHRGGTRNRVALLFLAVSVGLVVLVLVGSAIYAAGN